MRTPTHPALLAAIGAIAALALSSGGDETLAVVLGAAVGALWALRQRDAARLDDLGARLAALAGVRPETSGVRPEASGVRPETSGASPDVSGTTPEAFGVSQDGPGTVPDAAGAHPDASGARPAAPGPRPAAPRRVRRDVAPDALALAVQRAWAFATGGNPLVRVGLLILFVGLGVFLRYAAESGWLPVSVRLAATALTGVALGVVGWRLRAKNPTFGLAVQGGGVAVLYLTIYAAYALYGLLPGLPALVLMAAVAVVCAALALAQDAPGLAVLGVAGGFAAPVLAGTIAGQHVLLLVYTAGLNLGVLGIAWTRAWRSVAVVGFVSTFLTGAWWGGLMYRPELYATVQPFLILSFAVYLVLAVRFAVRTLGSGATPERALAVDGALVFGLPAATFALQSGLVEHTDAGRAWSAAALAAVYLAAYAGVRPREGLRLLADAFLAVGLVFATLALPLAFAAVVFGALWVLEGAALVWTGARAGKPWMRWSGLALQATAAAVLFVEGVLDLDRAFAPSTLTGWIVAVALGITAYVLWRWRADVALWERTAGQAALAFGLLWWAATATTHVTRLAPHALSHVALVAVAAASALLFLGLGRALAWPALRSAALLAVPAGLVLWFWIVVDRVAPHAHGGLAAWAALLGVAALAVRDAGARGAAAGAAAAQPLRRTAAFAGLVWLATGLTAHEAASLLPAGAGWDAAAAGAALTVALLAVARVRGAAPGERALAAWGLAVAAAGWSVVVPFATSGRTPPFPAVLNPLDIATVALVVALALAARALGGGARSALLGVAGGAALVGLAAVVARAAHAAGGVPYDADALWAAARFQAPLAIAWTVLALGLTVVAGRRGSRPMWVFGVAVLALVVVKLFAVDLAQARALEIVGAFVAVGLLVLVVGYRSPLPPRRDAPPADGMPPPDAPPHGETPAEAPAEARVQTDAGARDPGAA